MDIVRNNPASGDRLVLADACGRRRRRLDQWAMARHPGEPDVTPTVGINEVSSNTFSTVAIPSDRFMIEIENQRLNKARRLFTLG
jgi:hypothetical protein